MILSAKTSVTEMKELFMKALPIEIGTLNCLVIRDVSGLNQLSPKYYLKL